jgi:hypothetical protein
MGAECIYRCGWGRYFPHSPFFHAIGKNCRLHTNSQQPLRGYGLCGPAGWRRPSHLSITTTHAKCRRDGNGGIDYKGAHAAQRCRIIPITPRSYLLHRPVGPTRTQSRGSSPGGRGGLSSWASIRAGRTPYPSALLCTSPAEGLYGSENGDFFRPDFSIEGTFSVFSHGHFRTFRTLVRERDMECTTIRDMCVSLFVEVYESTKKSMVIV